MRPRAVYDEKAHTITLGVLAQTRGSFFFSSRRRHTRSLCDWSSDVCSSDLASSEPVAPAPKIKIRMALADFTTLGANHRRRDGSGLRLWFFHAEPAHRAAGLRQIGRASCRERV